MKQISVSFFLIAALLLYSGHTPVSAYAQSEGVEETRSQFIEYGDLGDGFDLQTGELISGCYSGEIKEAGRFRLSHRLQAPLEPMDLEQALGLSGDFATSYWLREADRVENMLNVYEDETHYGLIYAITLRGRYFELRNPKKRSGASRRCGQSFVARAEIGSSFFVRLDLEFQTPSGKRAFKVLSRAKSLHGVFQYLEHKRSSSELSALRLSYLQIGGSPEGFSAFVAPLMTAHRGHVQSCHVGSLRGCLNLADEILRYAVDERGLRSQLAQSPAESSYLALTIAGLPQDLTTQPRMKQLAIAGRSLLWMRWSLNDLDRQIANGNRPEEMMIGLRQKRRDLNKTIHELKASAQICLRDQERCTYLADLLDHMK